MSDDMETSATVTSRQLTPTDRQLLAREVAADKATNPTGYEAYRNIKRQAFIAGWDAAMEYVGRLIQTPGGDGCYCTHHPDDPAHTKDCYDLFQALADRY